MTKNLLTENFFTDRPIAYCVHTLSKMKFWPETPFRYQLIAILSAFIAINVSAWAEFGHVSRWTCFNFGLNVAWYFDYVLTRPLSDIVELQRRLIKEYEARDMLRTSLNVVERAVEHGDPANDPRWS